MTEKRFTTVELPKPNKWGIWYDGACLSTYQVCILLNEYVDVKKENEQLKSDNKGYVKRYSELFDEYKKNKNKCEELKQLIKETLEIIPMEHSLAVKLKNSIKEMYE